jgi:hypothetical protein
MRPEPTQLSSPSLPPLQQSKKATASSHQNRERKNEDFVELLKPACSDMATNQNLLLQKSHSAYRQNSLQNQSLAAEKI